jgi:[ribosomal protein S18]-alanine N-acetyltransferase
MIRASVAHAPALAAIHAASFPPGETWGVDAFAIQLALPGVFALLDPEGALILARVAADEAEILTLAVVPELRGKGHARALLGEAAATAAAAGAKTLFLEVSEANAPARRLYEAAGFAPAGRRRRYYPDGSDALVLSRTVTSAATTSG